jgi:hypothetical protein
MNTTFESLLLNVIIGIAIISAALVTAWVLAI